jgi:hypothetical protein
MNENDFIESVRVFAGYSRRDILDAIDAAVMLGLVGRQEKTLCGKRSEYLWEL